MKPVPIRRKGCKNAGWIWDETKTEKLVVPLHSGKAIIWKSNLIKFPPPKYGKYTFTQDYSSMLLSKPQPRRWWQVWRR